MLKFVGCSYSTRTAYSTYISLTFYYSTSRLRGVLIIINIIFKKDPTKIKNKNCIKYHRTTRTKNIFLLLPPLPLLHHLPLLPLLLSSFFFLLSSF